MPVDWTVRKGDTATPIAQTLEDADGAAINLQGATVQFRMWNERTGAQKVSASATNLQVGDGSDGSKGKVSYAWVSGDVDTAAVYLAEWKVTFPSGKVQSFPNGEFLVIAVTDEPTGLSTNALTTVSALSSFLDEPIAAGDPRRLAERLINGYSSAIQRYTEREFMPKTPTADSDPPVTRRFSYNGSGYLLLAPWDLRSLGGAGYGGTGAITLNTELPTASQWILSAGDTSTASEYRLDPPNSTVEGTYGLIRLPTFAEPGTVGREVSVSGYWGVGYVPVDVELACLMACELEWRREAQRAQRADFDTTEPTAADRGGFWLPFEARSLLFPFMRRILLA